MDGDEDEDRSCHTNTEYLIRSLLITLVQGGFACCLTGVDLVFHWNDYVFSPEKLELVFMIGAGIVVIAFSGNIILAKHNFNEAREDPNADAMDVVPSFAQRFIRWLSSSRKTFADFNHFAGLEETVGVLMNCDLIYGPPLIFFTGLGIMFCRGQSDDEMVTTLGTFSLVDMLNFISFIFTFFIPFMVVVGYSTVIRGKMLDHTITMNSNGTIKEQAKRERNRYSVSRFSSKFTILSLALVFAVRSIYFLLFENWGFWDNEFTYELHQSLWYGIAAMVLATCHFFLALHTLRRRTEWYDCISKVELKTKQKAEKQAQLSSPTERPIAKGSGILPKGVDFFYSVTHFLSASLIARAVFGAIVFSGEQGAQHRVVPVFFDLITCVFFLSTFRFLLYSDHILLDLMSGSEALQDRKKQTREVSAMSLISSMDNAFTTTIPIY